ncbi:GH1 family beta-glucosidase [Streptomyces sp. NA04227]|uniref:GH1 family beta-glucosidase n=1 Tax=Streptomyces sp. NA04227 TaxID=2742136 RepID=UPI0026DEEA81|nr:GH1 family beta-glucosidase [Streptomyces sp. NA04227]
MTFPKDFDWGVSMSAYQIEGAHDADGRGLSVWDTFSHRPGNIADGTTGDTACDHYHHWPRDLDLIAGLGSVSYRFSVSWSRVHPEPGGQLSTAGLDFYERLVDGMLERGIRPVLNLFHWDTPQWVQDAGGWRQRDTADLFAAYAADVAARLGDRVARWSTVNEMFEHLTLGHVLGEHAPGLKLGMDEAFPIAHHLMLAHGKAVGALRAASDAPVMLVNSYAPARPATDAEADHAVTGLYDILQNRLFTDPVLLGRYPAEVEPWLGDCVADGDLDLIAAPLDALGVNYYTVNAVHATEGPVPLEVRPPEGHPRTAFGWAVVPDGLRETLIGLHGRYGSALPPLYVSENGCAYDDVPGPDGRCDDRERIAFLDGHLQALRAALDVGVDVRGYWVWSLLDNFEWAEGYTKRFGLVHVDYPTQRRTPKASYDWYRELIAGARQLGEQR